MPSPSPDPFPCKKMQESFQQSHLRGSRHECEYNFGTTWVSLACLNVPFHCRSCRKTGLDQSNWPTKQGVGRNKILPIKSIQGRMSFGPGCLQSGSERHCLSGSLKKRVLSTLEDTKAGPAQATSRPQNLPNTMLYRHAKRKKRQDEPTTYYALI